MALPPKALESHWYQVLAEDGFQDIEDTKRSDRPLKEWQSFSRQKWTTVDRKVRRLHEQYYEGIAHFTRHKAFFEICTLLVKHGNCKITRREVEQIVELHSEGLPERHIAAKLGRSKTCIHKVIRRVRAWMRLL